MVYNFSTLSHINILVQQQASGDQTASTEIWWHVSASLVPNQMFKKYNLRGLVSDTGALPYHPLYTCKFVQKDKTKPKLRSCANA